MKNFTSFHFLIAALFCSLATQSRAQSLVGLRGGVNFANFKPGEIFYYDSRTGANVALLFNKPLKAGFSIQVEPGFSQRGARYETATEGLLNGSVLRIEEKGSFRMNLIELPILLQWKPTIGNLTGIVSLGPEFRYRVGHARWKYTSKISSGGVVSKDESDIVNLDTGFGEKAFDYSLVGGLGIGYPIKSLTVFGEARYHLGLRSLLEDVKMYHRGPSVSLGVLVPMVR